MSFPAFKKIVINSFQKRLIYSQLDQIDFGYQPIYLEITHLQEEQETTLKNIEHYISEHEINTYSYPIAIITDLKINHSKLFITNSAKNLPQFFKYKTRTLATKELQKLKYVELKQTHLNNLQIDEYEQIIKQYTDEHRMISQMQKELNFYNLLANKINVL